MKRGKNKTPASGSISFVPAKKSATGHPQSIRALFSYSVKECERWKTKKVHVSNQKLRIVQEAIADNRGVDYILNILGKNPQASVLQNLENLEAKIANNETEISDRIHDFFSLEDIKDERKRSTISCVIRPEQRKFRESLLKAYNKRCAITNCDVEEALEAAHIYPYNRGIQFNRASNGLLLRVDIHELFERYLLGIDPRTKKILIAPNLVNSYGKLAGKRIYIPENPALRPSKKALEWHFNQCQWINNLA